MNHQQKRRIVFWHDIAICLAFNFFLIVILNFWPDNIWRTILGLICLLFTPGYATLAALFTKAQDISILTRFGLSPIISIPVLTLIGILLNYSPWGLYSDTIILVITFYVMLCFAIASWRRFNVRPDLQYRLQENPEKPALSHLTSKIMLFVLSLLAASILIWGFVGHLLKTSNYEDFTEFYSLGSDGLTNKYLRQTVTGEKITLTLGIINHENGFILYHIILMEGNGNLQQIVNVGLENGQKWEQPCTFILHNPGENIPLSILLFRDGDAEPYRSLRLWVTVMNPSPSPATE